MKLKRRITHFADWIREDGAVSAACFAKPRAIDMKRASWTNQPEFVSCKNCLALLEHYQGEEVSRENQCI